MGLVEQGSGGHPFKLIVFNIQKSANTAMLMRTAYAFGCEELILVGRKKFKLTGASGTYKPLQIRHFFNMAEAATYCRESGFTIYGLEIGGRSITECVFDHPAAFVMGNEGRGISDARPHCDHIIAIPQWGGVASLNVAVAGGLVMFEFQRAQGIPPAEIRGERYVDSYFP